MTPLGRGPHDFGDAELLTRRVERPKLPAPVEVCTADPLNSGYREGA